MEEDKYPPPVRNGGGQFNVLLHFEPMISPIRESKQSLNCMNENDYDKEKCGLYFQNYRNCLDFWTRVKRDRRRLGIEPTLPAPEDREKVRQEYYNKATMSQR